jgi:hypothetical protein
MISFIVKAYRDGELSWRNPFALAVYSWLSSLGVAISCQA